jgi:L-ascorbate metabolism protein UlaG (beta-lactamase superfamily)
MPPRVRIHLAARHGRPSRERVWSPANSGPRRFPQVETGVLHLGGTRLPGGLMVTMDGRQGTDAIELIGADRTIPVQYDDYPVFASPLDDFRAEVLRRGLGDRVRFVERGQTVPLMSTAPHGGGPS